MKHAVMSPKTHSRSPIAAPETLYPQSAQRLRIAEAAAQIVGMIAAVAHHGLLHQTRLVQWELAGTAAAAMIFVTVALLIRYRWSRVQPTFRRSHGLIFAITGLWLLGCPAAAALGPLAGDWAGERLTRLTAPVLWTEACLMLRGLVGAVVVTRRATAAAANPALMLVLSFVLLVSLGTVLLLLPRMYADPATTGLPWADRFRIALFTATSASCVTGLVVVDTPTFWSPLGQGIILAMIQVGGLGIMTFGAFFALAAGRQLPVRESATMQELLESEKLGDVRRLLLAILTFTFGAELLGAVLLSGLWSDLPLPARAWNSAFHSVSAFCNAGFALTPNGLIGMETRWQIWGVVPALIIVGGLGFAVLYNVLLVVRSQGRRLNREPLFGFSPMRTRLSLTSRIVLITTALLLAGGAVAYFVLESAGVRSEDPLAQRIANAWFQSVTFRTAGFNTVDHGRMQPATKLLAIILMFIGASPGSTGGGIKTVAFALAVLGVISILQGRQRVEVQGRVVPELILNRALTIIALGMATVMGTTLLLVLFERQPERFLDHLFEATSAMATVGVSSLGTGNLTVPSQYVLVATMFAGRVGPLTLIIALAGRLRDVRYDYPVERVALG